MTTEAGSRNVRISPELMEQWGKFRTEDGYLVTMEWGLPDEAGWYEPQFTRHNDDRLVSRAAVLREVAEKVRARFAALRSELVRDPAMGGDSIDAYIGSALNEAERAILTEATGASE